MAAEEPIGLEGIKNETVDLVSVLFYFIFFSFPFFSLSIYQLLLAEQVCS